MDKIFNDNRFIVSIIFIVLLILLFTSYNTIIVIHKVKTDFNNSESGIQYNKASLEEYPEDKGDFYYKLNTTYGPSYKIPLKNIRKSKDIHKIIIRAKVLFQQETDGVILTACIIENDSILFYRGTRLEEKVYTTGKFIDIQETIRLNISQYSNDEIIHVYFWNPRNNEIFIDDFEIIFMQ